MTPPYVFLAALASLAIAPHIAAAQARACTGTWSAPTYLTRPTGEPVYVEHGVIATIDKKPLALGSPTLFWLTRDTLAPQNLARFDSAQIALVASRPGAWIDSEGHTTPLPSVNNTRAHHSSGMVAWEPSALTAVWSTGEIQRTAEQRRKTTSIDVALFDGTRWSAPRTIMRAGSLRLSPLPVSRAESRFNRRVVAALVEEPSRSIRIARNIDGEWSTADWSGTRSLTYASATTTADSGTLLVSMMAPNGADHGIYAMRTNRWPPVQGDWTAPIRIDSIPPAMTYEGFAWAHLGGDSIVVVWRKSQGGGVGLTSHVSPDGGRTWRRGEPLEFNGIIDGTTLSVDTNGRLHAVFRSPGIANAMNAPGAVMHTMWSSGRWTVPVAISSGPSVTAPGLGFIGSGRLLGTWSEMIAELSGGFSPKTLMSVWSPGCPTT